MYLSRLTGPLRRRKAIHLTDFAFSWNETDGFGKCLLAKGKVADKSSRSLEYEHPIVIPAEQIVGEAEGIERVGKAEKTRGEPNSQMIQLHHSWKGVPFAIVRSEMESDADRAARLADAVRAGQTDVGRREARDAAYRLFQQEPTAEGKSFVLRRPSFNLVLHFPTRQTPWRGPSRFQFQASSFSALHWGRSEGTCRDTKGVFGSILYVVSQSQQFLDLWRNGLPLGALVHNASNHAATLISRLGSTDYRRCSLYARPLVDFKDIVDHRCFFSHQDVIPPLEGFVKGASRDAIELSKLLCPTLCHAIVAYIAWTPLRIVPLPNYALLDSTDPSVYDDEECLISLGNKARMRPTGQPRRRSALYSHLYEDLTTRYPGVANELVPPGVPFEIALLVCLQVMVDPPLMAINTLLREYSERARSMKLARMAWDAPEMIGGAPEVIGAAPDSQSGRSRDSKGDSKGDSKSDQKNGSKTDRRAGLPTKHSLYSEIPPGLWSKAQPRTQPESQSRTMTSRTGSKKSGRTHSSGGSTEPPTLSSATASALELDPGYSLFVNGPLDVPYSIFQDFQLNNRVALTGEEVARRIPRWKAFPDRLHYRVEQDIYIARYGRWNRILYDALTTRTVSVAVRNVYSKLSPRISLVGARETPKVFYDQRALIAMMRHLAFSAERGKPVDVSEYLWTTDRERAVKEAGVVSGVEFLNDLGQRYAPAPPPAKRAGRKLDPLDELDELAGLGHSRTVARRQGNNVKDGAANGAFLSAEGRSSGQGPRNPGDPAGYTSGNADNVGCLPHDIVSAVSRMKLTPPLLSTSYDGRIVSRASCVYDPQGTSPNFAIYSFRGDSTFVEETQHKLWTYGAQPESSANPYSILSLYSPTVGEFAFLGDRVDLPEHPIPGLEREAFNEDWWKRTYFRVNAHLLAALATYCDYVLRRGEYEAAARLSGEDDGPPAALWQEDFLGAPADDANPGNTQDTGVTPEEWQRQQEMAIRYKLLSKAPAEPPEWTCAGAAFQRFRTFHSPNIVFPRLQGGQVFCYPPLIDDIQRDLAATEWISSKQSKGDADEPGAGAQTDLAGYPTGEPPARPDIPPVSVGIASSLDILMKYHSPTIGVFLEFIPPWYTVPVAVCEALIRLPQMCGMTWQIEVEFARDVFYGQRRDLVAPQLDELEKSGFPWLVHLAEQGGENEWTWTARSMTEMLEAYRALRAFRK